MVKQKILPLLILLLLSGVILSACVRPVSTDSTPTPRGTDLLDELLTATLIPVNDDQEEAPLAEDLMETAVYETLNAEIAQEQTQSAADSQEESTPEPSPTLHIITPTNTPEPTTETSPEETEQTEAENTPEPTNTPEPKPTINAIQINPAQEFKGAYYVDPMDTPSLWYDRNGNLADSEYLKMEFVDGQMNVTGKLNLWDTWWISGFTLNNFYIEMVVNSGECSGSDTYGMILRASQHGEPTRGYFVGFTCDGKVLSKRLESINPYVAISILNPTETELVNAGPNQTNIIGVAFDGNTITIYPNRYYFTTIQDSTFSYGRYGIYVQAGDKGNYTFSVDEIRSWGILD